MEKPVQKNSCFMIAKTDPVLKLHNLEVKGGNKQLIRNFASTTMLSLPCDMCILLIHPVLSSRDPSKSDEGVEFCYFCFLVRQILLL